MEKHYSPNSVYTGGVLAACLEIGGTCAGGRAATPTLSNTVYMQSKSMSRSSRAGDMIGAFKYTVSTTIGRQYFHLRSPLGQPWAPRGLPLKL